MQDFYARHRGPSTFLDGSGDVGGMLQADYKHALDVDLVSNVDSKPYEGSMRMVLVYKIYAGPDSRLRRRSTGSTVTEESLPSLKFPVSTPE